MAINISRINQMPDSDKARARSLDARTFTNQPNRQLSAEMIKKRLAIPTEILIIESNRLVNEINATINQVASNLNTIDETATDFRSTYDQEVSNINSKISVTNQNVSALSTTVSDNKTAIETRVQDLQDSLDTDIADLDYYAKVTLKNRIDDLSDRHEQDKGAHQTDYENLLARVNAILESSTEDLDSFKEVVDMVKNADDTIIETLSRKVNKSDVVDNLTSMDTNKPLSANQGKVLKGYVENYYYDHFKPIETKVINRDGGVILSVEYQTSAFESITSTTTDGTVKMIITY